MNITKNAKPEFKEFLPVFKFKTYPPSFTGRDFYLTMNGRNAIFHGLSLLKIKQKSTVLLPSFHCTALVDPVLSYGANIRYYTVNKDFSLNLDEIENLITSEVSALLFIHFFGFPGPALDLQTLCHAKGIALIEDCTHTICGKIGGKSIGSFGDVAVFSFRKILPVQDGGALLLNTSVSQSSVELKSPLLYHIRMLKWTIDTILLKKQFLGQKNKQVEKNENKNKSLSEIPIKKGPISHEDPEFKLEWVNWNMSMISKWILHRTDFDLLVDKRRIHYQIIHDHLSKISEIFPCFSFLPDDICPMGYPFLTSSSIRLDYRLRKQGIPAFSFGEYLHDTLDLTQYGGAGFLSKNLVILPVHQGLSGEQINEMLNIVENTLNR